MHRCRKGGKYLLCNYECQKVKINQDQIQENQRIGELGIACLKEREMAKTEFTEYTFTVKEGHPSEVGGEAATSLMCEPLTKELSFLGSDGFMSIRLKEGTSVQAAQEIAKHINRCVSGISVTTF